MNLYLLGHNNNNKKKTMADTILCTLLRIMMLNQEIKVNKLSYSLPKMEDLKKQVNIRLLELDKIDLTLEE